MRINALSVLFFGIACIEEILLMGSGFTFHLAASDLPFLS